MQPKRSFIIPGFRFAGISCGIKESGLSDLALIQSDPPAVVVGAFTTNRVQAAPVLLSKKNIRSGRCSAVVINSGNANACTGRRGLQDAGRMVEKTARSLEVPNEQVLVCSTGKIGVFLPIDRVLKGVARAASLLGGDRFMAAARAILTTDKGPKVASVSGKIGGKRFHMAGFAKGAGMIEPHLKQATMLAFFMTDLRIDRRLLSTIFQRVVDESFNRITVDGDMSTNDTVLRLANGAAGNRPIRPNTASANLFEKNLKKVMQELALKIVEDAEGGTKIVRIEARGAKNQTDARKICYAIARSPLVKTSFFGEDPNWGRILAAVGYSQATGDPQRADIYYESVCVAKRGISTGIQAERRAHQRMRRKRFSVRIDLHQGPGSFSIWTSDLTVEYVKFNASYRT